MVEITDADIEQNLESCEAWIRDCAFTIAGAALARTEEQG